MGLAATVMGAVVGVMEAALERSSGAGTLGPDLLTGLVPVLAGVEVSGLMTRWLGVHEAETLWTVLLQRLGRATADPKP